MSMTKVLHSMMSNLGFYKVYLAMCIDINMNFNVPKIINIKSS